MSLYPKIDNFSILLDHDCKRMLRRSSRKLLVNEVLEELNNKEEVNNKEEGNNKEEVIVKFNLLENILNILGCNKI